METYKIIRFHAHGLNAIVKRNVTFEEVKAHCTDPETSSRTCTKPENIAYTDKYGPWFDGYESEGNSYE